MLFSAYALALALQTAPPLTRPDTTPPADAVADAYLDAGARALVDGARERHRATDRSISEYRVLAKERLSIGLRALRRDRLLFRRELAAEILWRRDGTGRVEVLGAREVVPIAVPDPKVPGDATGDAIDLAFDPGEDLLVSGFDDEDGIRNPLAEGSEADYRFASGDTTRIRLPGGRQITLVELEIVPRRSHGLLLRGSLWLDLASHATVRGAFQLASPLNLSRDVIGEDDDIPGLLQPMIVDLRYLAVDYGLWEERWWMPRLISLEGEATIGSLARVPVRFERSYEGYEVSGDPPSDVVLPDRASGGLLGAEAGRECEGRKCWREVGERPDSLLLTSPHLPESVYGDRELISETELRELASVLGGAVPRKTSWRSPAVRIGYLEPDLVRYNRVEGLSLGIAAAADFGAAGLAASGRIGAADLEPNAELSIRREGFAAEYGLGVYRRLDAVAPDGGALGFGSAIGAFALGRDDGDYYRTLGVEVTGARVGQSGAPYRWRVYGERQSRAMKHTDLSLPWLLDRRRTFHENIVADGIDQLGAELEARLEGGLDPRATRWAVIGSVRTETGDSTYIRPAVTAVIGFALPGELVGALEAAGGAAFGEVPVQGLWHLGGARTVRGYGGASRISGEAFWRGRAEVGSSLTAARVTLFADAGWAGGRAAATLDPPLLSAGIGASLLDGLLRLDLARAMRGDTGWRLDLYLDGIL